MEFRNVALMKTLSKSIQLAPIESVNPASLSVLFTFIPQLDFYDAPLMTYMVRTQPSVTNMTIAFFPAEISGRSPKKIVFSSSIICRL